jgi:hypothetical protein
MCFLYLVQMLTNFCCPQLNSFCLAAANPRPCSLLTPGSSLLTPVQFAANPHRGRFSLLHSDVRPATCLPPPRAGAGRGIQDAVWSPCRAPRHLASPTCGVAGEPGVPAGSQLAHPRPYNSPCAPTWASVVRGEGLCAVNITIATASRHSC